MKYKGWEEFWSPFLQVQFHDGQPELWPSRERKAKWFLQHTSIPEKSKVLDLGCGDGLIDIWLSRWGYEVTAVDQGIQVLEAARQRDDTKRVDFKTSELGKITFQPETFSGILFIETLGLMSQERDYQMIQKSYQWLKPGGSLIIDCPEKVEENNSWSREFPQGMVRGQSSFNKETRLQHIEFFIKRANEEEFGLHDPYEPTRGNGPGILRYLYPKAELKDMLERAGFAVEEIPHYYPENYYGLRGIKK